MTESGREKYTYSNTHRLCRGERRQSSLWVTFPFSIRTTSPGRISRTKEKPQLSRAQLSEATAMPEAFSPRHRGR